MQTGRRGMMLMAVRPLHRPRRLVLALAYIER
jgi:hypothetical protein